MPTLDALDYERFSYDDPSERPLQLDEAVKRAREQRKSDPNNFYRIEPVDAGGSGFRVQRVSVASVYAEFLTRLARRISRGTAIIKP